MKFNKTVLALAVALVVTPSWGQGTNTVWKTTDGHNVITTNGECVRAIDFASLGRDSCHAPVMEKVVAVEVVEEVVEAEVVKVEVMEVVLEVAEPATAKPVFTPVTKQASIYFDTDSSELTSAAEVALNTLVKAAMAADQVFAVQVVGNADTRGDADYNLALSQRRTDAVIAYFDNKGLKTTSSFAQGEASPVIENGEENLAASRRTDVTVRLQVKQMN